jgi:hypothetical protein
MRNTLLTLLVACSTAACLTTSAQYKTYDYDTPSYIQFSDPRYEVSSTETNAVVTIVRTGDYRKQAAVEFTTREGTAEDGVDFQACGGKIVFMAGQSFRTITVPILRDSEPVAKTFAVELTSADPYTVVTTTSVEVEIKPEPPSLTIAVKPSGLVVSWPDSGSPFVLEAQVDGAWSAVATPPVLENGNWNVAIAPSARVALFRLRANTQTAQ